MKRLRLARSRATRSTTCFCDNCATVTHCDTSHRMAAIHQNTLRSVGLPPV